MAYNFLSNATPQYGPPMQVFATRLYNDAGYVPHPYQAIGVAITPENFVPRLSQGTMNALNTVLQRSVIVPLG